MTKTKKRMPKIIIITLIVIALLIALRIAISFFSVNKVATGLTKTDEGQLQLAGCHGLRNCTASTAKTQRNSIAPIAFDGSADEVIGKIATILNSQSGAQVQTQDAQSLWATFKTPLLGYIDDLEILVDAQNSVAHIRSASRIGQSDLGANRKRIESLRQTLQGKI